MNTGTLVAVAVIAFLVISNQTDDEVIEICQVMPSGECIPIP